MTPDARSPRTAAGRALLRRWRVPSAGTAMRNEYDLDVDAILAIEAQAAPPDALRAQRNYLKGAFLDDPLTFATDPDGDCWFCGVPTEPIEDHDEADMSNDCRVTRARAALAAPAGYRGRGANRNNPSLPVAAALDPADARTLLRYVEAVLTEIAADVEVGITATAGARRARDDIRAFFAAPATLPAIDTRIVWKRDHGMVIVYSTGDEEPQSLEIPAWAVRTIFDVAGKDPEEEARKVSAFINAHTGLDVERLARAYRAARYKAGAFDELDPLRQAVMIRDAYDAERQGER